MTLNTALYDSFEEILEEGLTKVCNNTELIKGKPLSSPDITERWDYLIKDYIADAVNEFNGFPEATIAWPAFLGMAVAHYWDSDWEAHKNDLYHDFYGARKFDDLDEHIMHNILGLDLASEEVKHLALTINSCTLATLALIRKQQIEPETVDGFYILARSYTVMFRLGAAIELERLGYKLETLSPSKLMN